MKTARTYHSPLRAEQTRQTRERILEGVLRVMARGQLTDLSIPALAREADVSVPTIYRYFHTKRELILALAGYALQQAGMEFQPLTSPEDFVASVRAVVLAYACDINLLRAVALSEQSADMREAVVPLRFELIDLALAALLERLPEPERGQLRASLFLLTTSSAVATCVDLLGMSGEEAADTITWAIQTLLDGAERRLNP